MAWYKDNKIVARPKSLILNGRTYVPPTDEQLLKAGYEYKEIEPTQPTYEERVVELIRTKYSVDDELAILRQRDTKVEEFAEYNAYCEECKQQAKNEML